jgi:site-specific recombinase XerD
MSKSTYYSNACDKVAGFRQMGEEFIQKLVINGRGKSTHENYLRQMAKMALHYDKVPLKFTTSEVEEYLYYLLQKDTDSKSSFKHVVYGLRKLCALFGLEELELSLPSIKGSGKLPVVFSHGEVKQILHAAKHLSEKVLLGLFYDTGVRIQEMVNVRIEDTDLERCQLHVRKTKTKRERYVPISGHAARGIAKHLALNNPRDYLFENPRRKGVPMSETGIRSLLKDTLDKTRIRKNASPHTFRHTFATHQLEAGLDIMSVKELLGHAQISSTLVYLQIAQLDTVKKRGCLDILYDKADGQGR